MSCASRQAKEMNLANAFGFAVALIGLAGHLSFTKLGHSKVPSKKRVHALLP